MSVWGRLLNIPNPYQQVPCSLQNDPQGVILSVGNDLLKIHLHVFSLQNDPHRGHFGSHFVLIYLPARIRRNKMTHIGVILFRCAQRQRVF